MKRLLSRWRSALRKNDQGASAVEFAILATPVIFLVIGILEASLMLLGNYQMDSAVQDIARQIRTGQAQSSNMSLNEFKRQICARMLVLKGDCMSDLYVDVKTFPDFSSISFPPAVRKDKNGKPIMDPNLGNNFSSGIGTAESVVGVRVYYLWDFIVPFFAKALHQPTVNGKILLSTATAFRNEPFN